MKTKTTFFKLLLIVLGIYMNDQMGIGEKIRIERLIKNYSQEYMSWALDISQAAYSKIERDETELTVRRIYAIAEILEISPFKLMPPPKYGIGINPVAIFRLIKGISAWFSSWRTGNNVELN